MQEQRIYQAGILDHKIVILKPTYFTNDFGEQVEGNPIKYIIHSNRKDIDNFDNKEIESGRAIVATGRTDYLIRYKSWLDAKCVINDPSTNEVMEILAISVVRRNEAQVLRCRRKDNEVMVNV